MPSVTPQSTVLVTGASGFIAAWICRMLLERGFTVRGTVRSASKGDYLRDIFRKYENKFSYVIVEDMAKEGAFDDAVKDVDSVLHTASTVSWSVEDPQEIIVPAVRGTEIILESIKNHGANVKRIVITSSGAAVIHPHKKEPIRVFTELDWNYESIKQVATFGPKASGNTKYQASKTLAELAAWDFAKANDDIKFDVVSVIPSIVLGPTIHDAPSADKLNLSIKEFRNVFYALSANPSLRSPAELLAPAGNVVDVRDVALAHVLALQNENAGGERFMASARGFCIQDIFDAANSAEPPLPIKAPVGTPGGGKDTKYTDVYDGSKAETVLGFKYTSLDKTVKDTLISLKERGF